MQPGGLQLHHLRHREHLLGVDDDTMLSTGCDPAGPRQEGERDARRLRHPAGFGTMYSGCSGRSSPASPQSPDRRGHCSNTAVGEADDITIALDADNEVIDVDRAEAVDRTAMRSP
jgi:hypothetical protein